MHVFQNHVLFKIIPSSEEIKNVTITKGWGEELTEEEFKKYLSTAKPIRASDPKVQGWHFAPWCHIDFETEIGKYRLRLFLGGLAELESPDGRKGFLLLELK